MRSKSEKSLLLTLSQASLIPLWHIHLNEGWAFQMMLLLQTAAKHNLHAKPAIGKLKAVIHPTIPRGVPQFLQSMIGSFARHG